MCHPHPVHRTDAKGFVSTILEEEGKSEHGGRGGNTTQARPSDNGGGPPSSDMHTEYRFIGDTLHCVQFALGRRQSCSFNRLLLRKRQEMWGDVMKLKREGLLVVETGERAWEGCRFEAAVTMKVIYGIEEGRNITCVCICRSVIIMCN